MKQEKCKLFSNVITGHINGLQKIWIFGDEFVFNSYEKYFKQQPGDDLTMAGYVRTNFEIEAFSADRYSSLNQNMVSHLLNQMS